MTKKIDHLNLRQLVAFAIFMEQNDGIAGKAPSYLLEKFEMCRGSNVPEGMMDNRNMAVLEQYGKRWGLDWDGVRDYNYVPVHMFNDKGEPTSEGLRVAKEKRDAKNPSE